MRASSNQALAKLKMEVLQTIDQLIDMYQGDLHLVHFTPTGLPKEEILHTAAAWEADLIVMGTHGRTGLLHLVMGSVASMWSGMQKYRSWWYRPVRKVCLIIGYSQRRVVFERI